MNPLFVIKCVKYRYGNGGDAYNLRCAQNNKTQPRSTVDLTLKKVFHYMNMYCIGNISKAKNYVSDNEYPA